MSSPLLWGPNNQAINLQNQQINATGQVLSSNGAKNYLVNPGFERGDTSGWTPLHIGSGSGSSPSWLPGAGNTLTASQVLLNTSATTIQPTTGAIYHDGSGIIYTCLTSASSTISYWSYTGGTPASSGTLTKNSGTGDSSITWSGRSLNSPGGMTATTVTSGSQLSGIYSASLSVNSSSVGDGFVSDVFTISTADQAKVLSGRIAYSQISGSSPDYSGTNSNLWGVFVYDVTNGQWIQPAGVWNFVQSSGVGICNFTFQTASNGSQYQIAVIDNFSASNYTTYFDDFFLGPQTSVNAPAMSDWVAYTPTFTGFGTVSNVSFKSRRIGDSLEVMGFFSSGTATAVTSQITLGYNGANANVTIDSNKLTNTSKTLSGHAAVGAASSTLFGWSVLATGANNFIELGVQTSAQGMNGPATGTQTGATSGNDVEVKFTVPISGWSSNTVSSADTDTRVVAFQTGNVNTGTTYASSTVTDVAYVAGPNIDTHGGYSGGIYTIPVTGDYAISVYWQFGSVAWTAGGQHDVLVTDSSNNSLIDNPMFANATATFKATGGWTIIKQYNAGQTLKLRAFQASGSSITLLNLQWSVQRLSGPAVVQATESVNARYTTTNAQAFTSGIPAVVTTLTKVYDSHNAMNASTGVYTVPVSGKYSIKGSANTTSVAFTVGSTRFAQLLLSGTSSVGGPVTTIWASITTLVGVSFSTSQNFNAGDTISMTLNNGTGTTLTLDGSSQSNWICIERVGN